MRQSKKLHERLIECLLECGTVTQAAAQAGVSRQHAHRLLKDRDFVAALVQARGRAFGLSMGRLCHLSNRAVDVLERALSGEAIGKTQFLAAKCVIEAASDAVAGDLEQRLTEVEDAIARMERNVT